MDTHPDKTGNMDSSKAAPSRETFALLESESELQRFVGAWKAGRLPKAEWTHAAHVAMAAYGDYGPAYIGTAEAYPQGGYETSPRASSVAPEVEPILMDAMKRLLGVKK